MKTPEEIAHETLGEGQGWAPGSHPALIELMVAAIEADREQPRFLLISEHDDTGVVGLYETREAAIDAAILNCDNDPEIWDDYYSIQEV